MVLITETVFDRAFATYARVPSGLNATLTGFVPTATFFNTDNDVVSITETGFDPTVRYVGSGPVRRNSDTERILSHRDGGCYRVGAGNDY